MCSFSLRRMPTNPNHNHAQSYRHQLLDPHTRVLRQSWTSPRCRMCPVTCPMCPKAVAEQQANVTTTMRLISMSYRGVSRTSRSASDGQHPVLLFMHSLPC